jgi:hypothetical protein
MNLLFVILLTVVFVLVYVCILIIPCNNDTETYNNQPVISETNFSIGKIEDVKDCVYANPCNDKVLYPVTQPNVDYGNQYPESCKCLQFIESP